MKKLSFLSIFCLVLFFSPLVRAEEVLTWDDCLKQAAKNNPELISAKETVSQAKASQDITASGLFPQLTGTLAASGKKTRTSGQSATSDTYSYGGAVSQLLFDGFKTFYNRDAAVLNVLSTQHSYNFSSAQTRLSLRIAFVNLLKAQEKIRVTDDILKIRQDETALISLRYDSGLEHKGAFLNAEASLAKAEFDSAQAKRDLDVARRQLIQQMGSAQFVPWQAKGDFSVKENVEARPDFASLVDNHPSFKQKEASKKSAEFGVKAATANFFPQVTADAGATKTGDGFLPHDQALTMGVTVSVPIFEGGLRQAQKRQAQSVLRQAQADEDSQRNALYYSLPQAWKGLQDSVGNVLVKQKILEAAQERANIAQAQYEAGFITYDSWTIIQDNLVQAKGDYLDAQANALTAEAQWVYAKGETLEYAQ